MKKFILSVLLLFSLLSLFTGCKKRSNKKTTVHFHIYNPVTKEKFENVHVKIFRDKENDFNEDLDISLVWDAHTNSDGRASYEFSSLDSYKYNYQPKADLNLPPGAILKSFPNYYNSIEKERSNYLNYVIVQKIQWIHHFKNVNCYDNNDRMRWRFKNITNGVNGNWFSWFPYDGVPGSSNGYFNGCTDHLTSVRVDEQKVLLSQMEVTKNDSTYLIEDTLYLTGENGIDTLKLFY